jgi:hypothetical protein
MRSRNTLILLVLQLCLLFAGPVWTQQEARPEAPLIGHGPEPTQLGAHAASHCGVG